MGFFDGLEKREKPNGGKHAPVDKGITRFVKEHFYEIAYIREKGYSWKQITQEIQRHYDFRSNHLCKNIQNQFNEIRR